ncbi:MAG: hypothetical protein RMX65_002345 [Nostoc sp. DedQUE01]|nr:hypothetical protein [Nostoc sp. DedQUE11]MDZ8072545.1 hypothetical protein [Nostoc sp. DedQUE01]
MNYGVWGIGHGAWGIGDEGAGEAGEAEGMGEWGERFIPHPPTPPMPNAHTK